MQSKSDAQLLREFAQHGTELAFTEIVTRHTNLVYSAALRQTESPDTAAEITQSTFIALARGARALSLRLTENASLAGWLCRSARNIALNLRRDEFRQHSRERQAMEQLNPTSEIALDWEHLRPVLDEAMSHLSEPDYDALVMRFFNNQDLRSIGRALGVNDDAAQKRVSRALDKLREHLSRRGIRSTATALSIVLSANAVQAAPIGLAVTIVTAANLTGTTVATTATAITVKSIAMTTLQKTLIGATLALVTGAGIYEQRQASRLRNQLQTLREQQEEQVQQLLAERDESAGKLAGALKENEQFHGNASELLRLRGEVARLRKEAQESAQSKDNTRNNGTEVALKSWLNRVKEFKRLPERMPEKAIPELRLLTEDDWLELAKEPLEHDPKEVNLDDDAVARLVFSHVRAKAKDKLVRVFSRALEGYAEANSGELPSDASQLKPYLMNTHFLGPARVVKIPESAVDDTVFRRYEILQTGKLSEVPSDATILAERAPVDNEYDTILKLGRFWMAVGGGIDDYSPIKRARSD